MISIGNNLKKWLCGEFVCKSLDEAVALSAAANPAFTRYMQLRAIKTIAEEFLSAENLIPWLEKYELPPISLFSQKGAMKVGIVMAGNIPLVGFHDLLCVLASGADAVVKLSSKDKFLLPTILSPFVQRIKYCTAEEFELEPLDALLTMGGDASSSYFNEKYPTIPKLIRGSRTSVAVIERKLSKGQCNALAEDITLYYGLGCRSVTHLLLTNYSFLEGVLKAVEREKKSIDEDFLRNSYLYQRALSTIEGKIFLECDPLIFMETDELSHPLSVVGYNVLSSEEIVQFCKVNDEHIQKIFRNFGVAQRPKLDDYPDGRDTIEFLLNIRRR